MISKKMRQSAELELIGKATISHFDKKTKTVYFSSPIPKGVTE